MGSLSVEKVPIIDFTREDLKPGTISWLSTCKDVCKALELYGCFVAIYNGVSQELDNGMFTFADELFDLPTEIKKQNVNDKPYHGYVGQLSKIPLHEGLGIDYSIDKEEVEKFTKLMWPNTGNDRFCENALSFSKAVAELDKMVVRMIFDNFGVEKYCQSHQDSTTYLLKFLRYRAPKETESGQAFPRHTDKSFLSILHQNHVNGLEVQPKNNDQWITCELPPNSFAVMAGDTAMGWSNDRIHSCDHRVTLNYKEAKDTRYTLGLFSFIKGMVKVPEELVDEEHPLKYKPFDNVGLLHYYATEEGIKHEYTVKGYCGIETY